MSKNAVFFYGLFMDPDLLHNSGFSPSEPKIAELRGYKLLIGQRATLVKTKSASAWGTIMNLSDEELKKLYSAPSVSDYGPVAVDCHLQNGGTLDADVYILPDDYALDSPTDTKYIDQLIEIARKLDLPEGYIGQLTGIASRI